VKLKNSHAEKRKWKILETIIKIIYILFCGIKPKFIRNYHEHYTKQIYDLNRRKI